MKTRLHLTLCAMALCLASCTIEPVVYREASGRTVASLGASLLTKHASKETSLTLPDGTVITAKTDGLDETKAASIWANNKLATLAAPVLGTVAKGAAKAIAP